MTEEPNLIMSAQEAIDFIADQRGIKSLYEMSKLLSNNELEVQPIQISNYRAGARMGVKVAKRFQEVFNIEISDVYSPGVFTK